MQNKPSKSVFQLGVRQKVLLVLVLVLLTSLTVSGWFALQSEKESLLKEVKQRGSDISRFVAKSLVYSVVGYDYHTIDLLLKAIIESEDVGYSKIVNRKGNTMAELGTINIDSAKMVLIDKKLILDEDVVGIITLGFSTEKTMNRIENQKFSLIKREAIIIILIALGEFFALSIIIIKPLSIMSSFIKNSDNKIGLGVIPITTNDEFGTLASQFNILSDELTMANNELQSRVDYADQELIKTNNLLLERSLELSELNDEFKKLSVTDSLTELYNRRYFEEALSAELTVTKRHGDTNSIIVIDIDHFKKVNDLYGHQHGDHVIKKIAAAMKKRLRESDVLCRIGGEEFVAICRRADKESAINLAEELRSEVESEAVISGEYEINITVSIGIVTVTKENIESYKNDVFKYADKALYHSKGHGRNKVTHYSDIG